MTNFPVVLHPSRIAQALTAVPSQLPSEPVAPPPPQLPDFKEIPPLPRRINQGVLFFDLAAIIPLSYLISSISNVPLLAVFFLALIVVGIYVGYKFQTYPRRKQKYEREYKQIELSNETEHLRYEDRLKQFDVEMENYRLDRERYEQNKTQHIDNFRVNLLRESLQFTVSYDGDFGQANIGYCERRFQHYLERYFSREQIYTGLTLDIPGFEHPYSPDFAYIDAGLHIDIEIDEPYAYTSREPIHYLGRDNRRNEFFLSKGWIVIRFAEEQVVKYPDECCKFIAEIIVELTKNESLLAKFAEIGKLPLVKQWTEEEALKMLADNYRETYTSICRNW